MMSRGIGIIFILLIGACAGNSPPDGLTICCAGDSLMRPIPTHLRASIHARERTINIANWAQGGLSSRTYLSFYRKRIHKQKSSTPVFILLQLGTNDVEPLYLGQYTLPQFEANLKLIIDEFKKFSVKGDNPVKIFIASIPPLFAPEYDKMNHFIHVELNPLIKNISETAGVFFVDNWRVLDSRPHLYRPDGVHPNADGERVLTQNWIRAIRRAVRSFIPPSENMS